MTSLAPFLCGRGAAPPARSSPALPVDMAAKLMHQVNPGLAGSMHGILPLHLGMRIRLLEHLDLQRGLATAKWRWQWGTFDEWSKYWGTAHET